LIDIDFIYPNVVIFNIIIFNNAYNINIEYIMIIKFY